MDTNRDSIGRFINGHSPLLLKHTEITKNKIRKAQETPINKNILKKLYIKNNMSLCEIADELNLSRGTVSKYFHRQGFSLRKSESIKQIKWTKTTDIAYILGVVFGDGSITYNADNRNYTISLTTSESIFAESFKSSLEKIGLNPCLCKDRCYFKVAACSKLLYNFIKNQKTNYNNIVQYHKTNNLKIQFIKGFYESEGGDEGHGHGLRIYNTDKHILNIVKQFILEALNIDSNYFSTHKNTNGSKDVFVLHIPSRFKKHFINKVKPVIKLAGNTKGKAE